MKPSTIDAPFVRPGLSSLYLIDPQGRLIYAGAIDSIPSARVDDIKTATNYVRQGLAEALAGKPMSVRPVAPADALYG